jgi:mannose-6-phosphate isomerase
VKLEKRQLEKPWGRTELPPVFQLDDGSRIGEIWFEAPNETALPLLVKYIFTSERLSIQVHPNDDQARERGYSSGKTECWYILAAEPGATIGVGLTRPVEKDALRAAAVDGSIETLIDWRPVCAGDFFYVPAGTIHAIGGGVSLIEVQQMSDVTYRLFDYGRPRELHLDDGVRVSHARPYPEEFYKHIKSGSHVLVPGPHFTLLRLQSGSPDAERLHDRDRLAIPIEGTVKSGAFEAVPGECLLVPAGATLEGEGAWLLAATGALED